MVLLVVGDNCFFMIFVILTIVLAFVVIVFFRIVRKILEKLNK